ncbi:hypothetical protein VSX64_08945 [Aurantimonas sp. C2-6-R+9]|uniref:hypothetical protein n=1 Tax=unclassified Aurantimonas TaxID=2638230 RepID=UPI002E18EDD9|nr:MULTISPECIES: hypothetical protein [unclassified Aurantimonas]MEC5292732.1 hypothetical protein [Aurantimonas sp. C2-3-R2]MEC5381007.1 hypothetical protein [Aurantimonas sp. C2-6-R+9]MEC5413760.1 hypothetical protein [Aurantimonas sp. C2-4-R8]
MARPPASRPRWIIVLAIIAVVFGVLTLYSGGAVLVSDGPERAAAGAYVPFVLWFNVIAGLAYIIAGIGLYSWRRWAVNLSILLAVATLLVFAAFGVHIMTGGSYEVRTIVAMTLRSTVWLTIASFAWVLWTRRDQAE